MELQPRSGEQSQPRSTIEAAERFRARLAIRQHTAERAPTFLQ
jgi:hypothetical protein